MTFELYNSKVIFQVKNDFYIFIFWVFGLTEI